MQGGDQQSLNMGQREEVPRLQARGAGSTGRSSPTQEMKEVHLVGKEEVAWAMWS